MIYNTHISPFHHLENYPFTLHSWLKYWYPSICKYLDIEPSSDYTALKKALSIAMSTIQEQVLTNTIRGKKVCIVAPGPSLEEHIDFIDTINQSYVIIAVDGATQFLIENGIYPNIIVTDFDGNIEAQLLAQERGSLLLLHVHGDNFSTVNHYLPLLSQRAFAITTQISPAKGSFNFLGFSDGDRAVCLAHSFHASEILLIGFDFGEKIGYYSKGFKLTKHQKEKKLRKFVIAQSVINWCASNSAPIKTI